MVYHRYFYRIFLAFFGLLFLCHGQLPAYGNFPVRVISSLEEGEDYVQRDIFPPLYRQIRSRDDTYLARRFFLAGFYEREKEETTTYIVYPLYRRISSPYFTRHSFTPLATHFSAAHEETSRRRMGIYPLIHSDVLRDGQERMLLKRYLFPVYYYKNKNVSSLIFPGYAQTRLYLPFYFGLNYSENDYFRAYILNLLAFDESPSFKRFSFLYPIFTFSYQKNRFIRVFPLFIHFKTDEPYSSRYTSILWPFYIHSQMPDREARILLPFYLRFQTENRLLTSRFIFYLHDHRYDEYERTFYLFPFLGREIGEDYTKTHFIYPLGHRLREDEIRETRLRGLFTLYRDPKEETLSWSFLFGMFRYERKPDTRKWQFTPLVRYEREEDSLKFFLVPVVQRETGPDETRWRLLGPLFTTEIDGYEKSIGYYLRLYNREKTEDSIEGDALFRLLEWESDETDAQMNINLLLLQLRAPWFQ